MTATAKIAQASTFRKLVIALLGDGKFGLNRSTSSQPRGQADVIITIVAGWRWCENKFICLHSYTATGQTAVTLNENEKMPRKLLRFYHFLIVTLILAGCASRYQLPRIKPTEGYVNRQIEVRTKQGQKYRLISYQITSTKIVGKDKQGIQYEESIENVRSITVIYKQNLVEVVAGSAILFLAFMAFLWVTLPSSL